MTISSLKELSKLVDLCRKKGIDSIEIDGIKFSLTDLNKKKPFKDEMPSNEAPTYTSEDILNWSIADGGM